MPVLTVAHGRIPPVISKGWVSNQESKRIQAIKTIRPSIEPKFLDLRKQLASISQLSDNWDSYGAPRPLRESVDRTERALSIFHDLLSEPLDVGDIGASMAIVPSAEGGAAICFTRGDRYSHMEFLNSGEATLIMYEGQNAPIIRPLESNITQAAREICRYMADEPISYSPAS